MGAIVGSEWDACLQFRAGRRQPAPVLPRQAYSGVQPRHTHREGCSSISGASVRTHGRDTTAGAEAGEKATAAMEAAAIIDATSE